MKKFKKAVAFTLCAAMLTGLAACGGDNKSTTAGGSDTTAASGGETTEAASGSDTTAPSGGGNYASVNDVPAAAETRTIKIGTWYDHFYDSTMSGIDVNPNVTDPERDQKMFDNLKEVEQKYNVKIEFVNLTWDGIQESINTSILAGKPDCDIYEADVTFAVPAVANGYVQKLDDVIPADANLLNGQEIFAKADAGLEGNYLFLSNSGETQVAGTYMLAFNTKMLKDAGLEDPNVLFEKGEWTWDKYREYLQKLTQDTNGDGVTDVYGYDSRPDFLVDLLLMSNGTTIAGGATENLSSKEVGECLDFINTMYNVDKTARPWVSADDSYDDHTYSYFDGKCASWITAAWISATNNKNDAAELGADFETWVPFPIGPSGNAETNGRKKTSSGNVWFIPTGVEDPAFVYTVFEAWQNWYKNDYAYRDADMTWWEDAACNEANYKVMEWTGEAGNFDLWNALGVDYQWPALMMGEKTPAQIQEEGKQLLQTALDQMYK